MAQTPQVTWIALESNTTALCSKGTDITSLGEGERRQRWFCEVGSVQCPVTAGAGDQKVKLPTKTHTFPLKTTNSIDLKEGEREKNIGMEKVWNFYLGKGQASML